MMHPIIFWKCISVIGAFNCSLNQMLMNPVAIEGMRPANEIMRALTPIQVKGHRERKLFLLKFLSFLFCFFFLFQIAFEDIDVINSTTRQRCYKMGSLFQSDAKGTWACFVSWDSHLSLPAWVCVGAKVLTPDQTALALEFKFAKWAPLSECLQSLISAVEECCRGTGGGRPCPWHWLIYADVAYAQSPEPQAPLPANSWCLIQITSLLWRANLPIIPEIFD